MNSKNEIISSVFKSFSQVIWIVTAADGEKRSGLTATWVHQASIDFENPVVNIGLAPNHFTCELADRSKRIGLHLLRVEQTETAYHFAHRSGREIDKFKGHDLVHDSNRAPILVDCHSSFECEVFSQTSAGDRVYFLADVTNIVNTSEGPVMREHDFFSKCNDQQIELLRADLRKDVKLQRPLLDEFKQSLF